jgi:hypothetical protein
MIVMDIAELQNKLLEAARSNPPDERVPYAFEKRVMARLAGQPAVDILTIWNRLLWRAAAPCVAVTFLLGVWSFVFPHPARSGESLAAELESSLYTPFDSAAETW